MTALPYGLPTRLSDARHGVAAVDSFLTALGLPRDYLRSAVQVGLGERRSATRFDPTNAGGFKDWMGRVRELRRQLFGDGWEVQDLRNAPFAKSPTGDLLVGVMQGDAGTGNLALDLQSEYPKGITMEEVTRGNETTQLTIDHELGIAKPTEDLAKVWLVVTRFVSGNGAVPDVVHLEVSQPAPSKNRAVLTEWSRRCCLNPFEFPPIAPPGDGAAPRPIDVPVHFR